MTEDQPEGRPILVLFDKAGVTAGIVAGHPSGQEDGWKAQAADILEADPSLRWVEVWLVGHREITDEWHREEGLNDRPLRAVRRDG
jgi:hypothetical protein